MKPKTKKTKTKKIIKKPNPDSSSSTSFTVVSAREGASCTAESLESQQLHTPQTKHENKSLSILDGGVASYEANHHDNPVEDINTQGENTLFSSRKNSGASDSDFSLSSNHPLLTLPEKSEKYIEVNNQATFNTILHVMEMLHDKTNTQINKTEDIK